jgi:hypothetical protein
MAGGGKQTTTSELKLPEWLSKGAEDTFGKAQIAAEQNPIRAYVGQIAPGSNANLDSASAVARDGQGAGMGDLNAARRLTAMASMGSTPRVSSEDWNGGAAARYMNPYQDAVQGRTLDEMARRNRGEVASIGDAARGSRAFGGTRHAVLEAETRSGQNRNMLDFLAESNQAGYNDAYGRFATDRSSRQGAEATNASLTQGDFMRMMQGGGQMAGIGTTAAGMRSSSIEDLLRTGGVQQNTERGQMDAEYDEFLRMQDAPMQRYMQLMGMLSGAPSDRSETSTSRRSNSALNTILGVGTAAASIFSDRRLKRRVVRIGQLAGLPLYSYRYLWSNSPQMGFMADEVAKVMPQAVRRIFGFDTVDYGMVLGKEATS